MLLPPPLFARISDAVVVNEIYVMCYMKVYDVVFSFCELDTQRGNLFYAEYSTHRVMIIAVDASTRSLLVTKLNN